MFKHEEEDEEQLLETLALTSKLERSLRKIASSRKYNTIQKTQEKTDDRSAFVVLEKEVKKLRKENQELFRDNEEVCRDVIRLRDQNRVLKGELAESKKYIAHLQGYNGDLKKQLLFWMRKPQKKQEGNNKEEEDDVG